MRNGRSGLRRAPLLIFRIYSSRQSGHILDIRFGAEDAITATGCKGRTLRELSWAVIGEALRLGTIEK